MLKEVKNSSGYFGKECQDFVDKIEREKQENLQKLLRTKLVANIANVLCESLPEHWSKEEIIGISWDLLYAIEAKKIDGLLTEDQHYERLKDWEFIGYRY